jgi:hypothetical protein
MNFHTSHGRLGILGPGHAVSRRSATPVSRAKGQTGQGYGEIRLGRCRRFTPSWAPIELDDERVREPSPTSRIRR